MTMLASVTNGLQDRAELRQIHLSEFSERVICREVSTVAQRRSCIFVDDRRDQDHRAVIATTQQSVKGEEQLGPASRSEHSGRPKRGDPRYGT